jgi:methionyl-tRNA formyltransferase
MKLIFMGTPAFALPSLQALLESTHDIVCVYTQPPRPAGRGKKLSPSPIQNLAEEHNIPVRTPRRLRDEALEELRATPCDAIVVVAYGLLLPQPALDHAPCLNVHPSALPRWRGPAPIQHTLLAGDKTTEICIMQLDAGMDTGPVYQCEQFMVQRDDTYGDLHDKLAKYGALMLVDVLDHFTSAVATPQPNEGITLAPKITPDMRSINWKNPAGQVHNHIRALSPTPGATCRHGPTTLKILRSTFCFEEGAVGEILNIEDDGIVVGCGEKSVKLLTLQRPGKQAMAAGEFTKGYPLQMGDKLT